MIVTIRLYGKMGKLFGRVHKADLSTGSVAEAVKYLRANFPGVDPYLTQAKTRDGVGFAVFRGKENLKRDQFNEPCFGEDIRIAPIILGSKNGGILNIVLGVVLIVVGFVVFVGSDGLLTPVGQAFVGAGISLIAGGVIQLLTPRPKGLSAQDSPQDTPSYAFNGPINTQAQGHPVPLLYGRLWVGSAVISAGMDVKDNSRSSSFLGSSPKGWMGGGQFGPNKVAA